MRRSEFEIKYVELKSGYADNGPAWIGRVKNSKTGNTDTDMPQVNNNDNKNNKA
jgi:hypothetical protein